MMISTRGRYALRVIIDLAEHNSGAYIPLKEIAKRQDISQKYMETIMAELSKNGLVDGLHGKGGGYRLNRAPETYKVGDIQNAPDVGGARTAHCRLSRRHYGRRPHQAGNSRQLCDIARSAKNRCFPNFEICGAVTVSLPRLYWLPQLFPLWLFSKSVHELFLFRKILPENS